MKAFPGIDETMYGEIEHNTGMDLRDYFAAKAMQGLMSTQWHENCPDNETLCKWAYDVADKMMKARKK